MKWKRIMLAAAGLLLVAGCSDEATAPVPAPQAVLTNPPDLLPGEGSTVTKSFKFDGASWSVSLDPRRVTVSRNGQALAQFNGTVAEGSSGTISAIAYENGQYVTSAGNIAVQVEPYVMNQMLADFPCEAEIRALVASSFDFAAAAIALRNSPSIVTAGRFAYAASLLYGAAMRVVKCFEKLESRPD